MARENHERKIEKPKGCRQISRRDDANPLNCSTYPITSKHLIRLESSSRLQGPSPPRLRYEAAYLYLCLERITGEFNRELRDDTLVLRFSSILPGGLTRSSPSGPHDSKVEQVQCGGKLGGSEPPVVAQHSSGGSRFFLRTIEACRRSFPKARLWSGLASAEGAN